ncbi:MAG: hypothetical protein R3202_01730 [Candidatus Competibacterales bacterium]|nr:hypothetical protein [Candidatus Competibacterales bacterium]
MSETAPSATPADQDFVAALHEIRSNLDVRRLMFVFSNVMIPALTIALVDTLTGSHYPPHLLWLPLNILPVVGLVLSVAGVLVTVILTRCHFGLVINGNKMGRVVRGELRLEGLNWLGVTTNFVAMTALYAGSGLALLLAALGLGRTVAAAGGVLMFVLLLLTLRWNHARANRRSAGLRESWQPGPVSVRHLEEHARESLDATTADISVIVVMAIALFSGTFGAMTSLGGIPDSLALTPAPAALKTWGVPLLSGFTLLSLLLSDRMVLRLRIALAQHAQRLAELRDERDDPWTFRLQERTYLLFALLHLLTSCSAVLLVWSLSGQLPAILAGGLLFLLGLLWYPWQLARARPTVPEAT